MILGTTTAGEFTRRAFLATLALAGAGYAILPRAPRSTASIPLGRVVIDYWEKWTGIEGDALQTVIDEFNATHSRIWVRRTPVSEIMSKAMVAISGGDPPDVVGLFSFSVPQFAETSAAIPFDELASAANTTQPAVHIDPDAYAPAVLRLLSHGNRQWAGVSSMYNLALYSNRTLFREVGLDPDKPPRTIEELDALAPRFDQRNSSGTLERVGFLPRLPEWWPYFWPVMFGGRLYDPTADKAILTDQPTIDAYSWIASTAARLGITQGRDLAASFSRSFHSPRDPFISGKAAMIVQGPWIANFIKAYNPALDYAASPVPVASTIYNPTQPRGMLEADVLIIPQGSRHPLEAFEFVAWMQTQHAQEKLARLHGKGSPLRRVSPGFYTGHVNRSVAVHDAITASPDVLVLPQTRSWQAYADLMNGMFDAIWRGADVRATLTDVEQRAQAMLDQAARLRAKRTGAA